MSQFKNIFAYSYFVIAALSIFLNTPAIAGELALVQETVLPPLPVAVSNNAVTAVITSQGSFIVSFAGLGSGKSHDDTYASTFVFDAGRQAWKESAPVPGGDGRLASVAVAVDGLAYVFGGYAVASDGSEVSLPHAHSFDPQRETYSELTPMPVPVDDAVAVTFEDRYIYLISGWHDFGNVNLVQRYDTVSDSWIQATPIPGPAVFGHAGGIVDNRIVYCDGVAVKANVDRRRDFVATSRCYVGLINEENGRRIDWRSIPPHPGEPRYRMAAAGVGIGVLFIGGSANPYNFNGIGYNGEPSQPAPGALLYVPLSDSWHELPIDGDATMDHRGLVKLDEQWLTLGGMLGNQQVTDRVNSYR
ncbi:MAG: galactose oxidase, partial [Woeseiaceae bacterium]|nr:galactose oxidase [Woeseiaceae bacterium]